MSDDIPKVGTTEFVEWYGSNPDDPKRGIKYDDTKPRWDLLPPFVMTEVVKVLTYGATKYDDDNWRKVPWARRRYYAACLRHLTAWWEGERRDPETGLHHLAHAVSCLLFTMYFDLENDNGE